MRKDKKQNILKILLELERNPKSWTELVEANILSKNALNDNLKFLIDKDMIKKEFINNEAKYVLTTKLKKDFKLEIENEIVIYTDLIDSATSLLNNPIKPIEITFNNGREELNSFLSRVFLLFENDTNVSMSFSFNKYNKDELKEKLIKFKENKKRLEQILSKI